VKNLFLWSGRSLVRKALEAYLTVVLELLLPKRRILELYLNVAEFGSATYGVGAASMRFFGKSAADLRPDEAALLAAVLPSPSRFDVRSPSDYVRQRQRWILGQMRSLGGSSYLADL
jgi:monofunctional biosynthetic peptidoglycan transglycosylase